MKVLHLPEIAHRPILHRGIVAGAKCRRCVPVYSPLGRLLGWDACDGRMVRRNGRETCDTCKRVSLKGVEAA